MSHDHASGTGSQTGTKGKKSAAERSPVKVGELVAGKYLVEEILAAGGMGVVVAARHVQLEQRFAIKFLLADSDHARKAERFLREARAAARIESTHVCRVFDCGTLPDGTPYMVMEHLVGRDLGQELKSRGKLPVAEAVDLVLQGIEGIAEAHAAGIVHRDLKPTNLFLCQKPGRPREVKVVDFGISKVMATDASVEEDLTATAAMIGSPRYMSPEQVQDAKNVDARTDIWSLGVIIYQLLDGKSPFAGTTMGETIGKVLLHVPAPLREQREDVPPALAEAIERCLQRDRDKRYRNVAELALALAPFGSGAAQSSVQRVTALLVGGQLGLPGEAPARERPAPTPPAPLARASDEPSMATVGGVATAEMVTRPKRHALYLGLGALALALAVAAALVVYQRARSPQPASDRARPPTGIPAVSAPPSASASAEPSREAPAVSRSALPSAAPLGSGKKPAQKPGRIGRPKSADDLLNDSY